MPLSIVSLPYLGAKLLFFKHKWQYKRKLFVLPFKFMLKLLSCK